MTIKSMWYIYTMGYYSAVKNNEIMPPAATLMTYRLLYSVKSEKEKYR